MSGINIERVTTVLVEAFASQTDLERMARFALDIALDEKINVHAGRHDQVFDLVQWARRERKLDQLVAKAAKLNPGFPALRALADDMADKGLNIDPVPDAHDALRWNPGTDGFAMFCDRTPQWRDVQSWASQPRSELIFLPGSLDQGHSFLMKRIKRRLALDPRSIIEVGLAGAHEPPNSEREMLELLARAMDLEPDGNPDRLLTRIARELAARLADRNVVILHPTLKRFHPGVLPYYTNALPEIVRQAKQPGNVQKSLKCYQPIEWFDLPWMRRLVAAFQRRRSVHLQGSGAQSARDLMKSIEANVPNQVLFVSRVPELCDLTKADLVQLCDRAGVGDDDQQLLLNYCAAVPTSRLKLEQIDTWMPEFIPTGERHLDDDDLD